jgi:hypothetical protein
VEASIDLGSLMGGGVETGRFRFIYCDSIPHSAWFVKAFFKKIKNIFSTGKSVGQKRKALARRKIFQFPMRKYSP